MKKFISVIILLCFFVTSETGNYCVYAQAIPLPQPGTMVNLNSAYTPVLIKGLKVHPENPFLFDFIIDTGNSGLKADDSKLKEESNKLIKYFLASLTVPVYFEAWRSIVKTAMAILANELLESEGGQLIIAKEANAI